MVVPLLEQIVTILVPPNFVHAHGKLEVPVSLDSHKVGPLILLKFNRLLNSSILYHLIKASRLVCREHLIELCVLYFIEAHVCHVHCFVIRVGRQLVLFVFVVQVSNIIVTNTSCFVVLSTK